MGFNEFGQSLAGIIIFGVVMLVAFGGFQNQSLYSELLPNSVGGPNDINAGLTSVTVSNTGTPYATPATGSPASENNNFLNLIFTKIGEFYNLFSKMPSAIIDSLSYIGLPPIIVYVIGVPLLLFAGIFLVYFVVTVASGLIGKGGAIS